MATGLNRYLKVASFSFLALCILLGAWLVYHEMRVPQNQDEVLIRMLELTREHRFDAAVKVVQTWMSGPKFDKSRGNFLYGQIAFIYIAKARSRPSTKAESVRAADVNLGKYLASINEQSSESSDAKLSDATSLFEIGGTYEVLGDTADENKCQFYAEAEQIFQRELPLISGDSYTAYGKTFQLEPLRATTRRHLDAVSSKSNQVGCKTQ